MTHENDGTPSYLKKTWNFLCRKMGCFMENHCVNWKVIPIVAVFTYYHFWHLMADVPLILWRLMLKDYLLIISLPLYLVVFSKTINGIYEYSLYETQHMDCDIDALSKDVLLSLWEEIKYYKFVDKRMLKPIRFEGDETDIIKEMRKYVGDEELEVRQE